MDIKLHRRYKGSQYTIGDLYINGKKFCETLEDTDRNLSSSMSAEMIIENKLYGFTAIPTGTYPIEMGTVSQKFKSRIWATRWGGRLPRVLNVPGYSGILIHVGTTKEDTSGCILVGWNKEKGKVIDSANTFDKLMSVLVEAWYRGEYISITIE